MSRWGYSEPAGCASAHLSHLSISHWCDVLLDPRRPAALVQVYFPEDSRHIQANGGMAEEMTRTACGGHERGMVPRLFEWAHRRGRYLSERNLVMPIFDVYLFADYSGAGEHRRANRSIRLYKATRRDGPVRLFPKKPLVNFSRDSLRERVLRELALASAEKARTVLGFDHQYSWPPHLWALAGLQGTSWREAVRSLKQGNAGFRRPPLDIPSRFCRSFNAFAGQGAFWSPLKGRAAQYGIPTAHLDVPDEQRFRLTETVLPFHGRHRPKPADAVGGMGEGIVGGQSICGLGHMADLLDLPGVAWWPFDGLSIAEKTYVGKHVGVEIYPSALRPASVPQTDDNDAYHSCLYVRDVDLSGRLRQLLDLSSLAPPNAARVLSEGWIIGMNPAGR